MTCSSLDAIVAVARSAPPERWSVGPIVRRDLERFAVVTGDAMSAERLAAGGDEAPPMYLTSVLDWGDGEDRAGVRADGLSPREAPHVGDHDVRVVHGGQRLTWHRPLRAGADRLVAERSVVRAEVREGGRAGRLALIDLETRYVHVSDGMLTRCREAIMCLASQAPVHAEVRPASEVDAHARFDVEDRFDERRLIRFSAVTWNSHRIHVDSTVACQQGFAGPVVHSTLHGTLMWRAAVAARGHGAIPVELAWRNVAPATAGEVLRAAALPVPADAQRMELLEWAADGVVTARGSARFGPIAGPGVGHGARADRQTRAVGMVERGARS